MKRMKKDELLELIKTLKIDKEEFWVLSSGALVLRGIYPDAVDIAVTNKGLDELKNNYSLEPKGKDWYKVNDRIECVCDGDKEKLEYYPEKVGDYYVQNIHDYLKFLKQSKREKDKLRIKLVEDYIENRERQI